MTYSSVVSRDSVRIIKRFNPDYRGIQFGLSRTEFRSEAGQLILVVMNVKEDLRKGQRQCQLL
jgi:hypothetical protein